MLFIIFGFFDWGLFVHSLGLDKNVKSESAQYKELNKQEFMEEINLSTASSDEEFWAEINYWKRNVLYINLLSKE